jgi:hypothetical protein
MSFGIPVRNGLSIGLLASTFLTSGSGRLVPRLTLNFLTGAPLDSRITFSRTTNATLVDSTGRVTYAPNNLVLRSEEFDNAAWTKESCAIIANSVVAPDGTTTADTLVRSGTSNSRVLQAATTTATSSLSVYAKAGTQNFVVFQINVASNTVASFITFDLTNGSAGISQSVLGSLLLIGSAVDAGNGWYRCSVYYETTTSSNIRIGAANAANTRNGDDGGTIFIWGAQLEQVTYQTLPSTYVQTVASAYYGPRFDYDPVTLAPRGLLIEEQRVNLVLYSEQFDNAGWTKLNGSVTANTTTSPDGTTNADAFIENTAASAFHAMSQAVAKAASNIAYAGSFYIKNKGRQVAFNIQNAAGSSGVQGRVNPATGTVTQNATAFGSGFTAGTITMTDAGNGWYRVVMTATSDISVIVTFQLILHNGTSSVYTGDGVSGAFLYGAQLEAGAFATSYIPTVASTVTRAADDASMTGTNFSSWYNASEGTVVVSADSSRGGVAGTTRNFLFVDGTATNIIRSNGTNTLQVIDASVTQASIAGLPLIPFDGTVYKFASAFKVNDFATVTTGAVVTDTSGTVPTGINQLVLGGGSSTTILNGHIRTFTFYATRLTNAQLQALTA